MDIKTPRYSCNPLDVMNDTFHISQLGTSGWGKHYIAKEKNL